MGNPPTFFSSGGRLHSEIRREMRRIYESSERVPYTDATAMQLIEEGRHAYFTNRLDSEDIVQSGAAVFLFSWLGDDVNEALGAIFRWRGFNVYLEGLCIIFSNTTKESVIACIQRLRGMRKPTLKILLDGAENLEKEKWDWALSRSLLEKTYESAYMDLDAAWDWLSSRT
jgi:ATP-dependent Lhr-like helicase